MTKNAPITTFPCPYGKYELLKHLGSGGMAEVFLARLPGPEGFERSIVIKRILPALAHDQRMEDAFIAEATLAAQVQHKNIVQVFELQRLDSGELFMSMEYVDGTDLARLLRASVKRRLRIPPWFSIKCIAEVLDGLAYAHELKDKHDRPRNLVHRDVTPSNIFISKQGAVKLADFGVAKDETRVSQTLRGELKGKLSYMPPEQIRRQPIDRRTDIFAVGVVLWEFLAQKRLFGGARHPEIETMNLICSAPRIPPSVHKRDVHPDLDRCVLRALQVDPEARYQDARGFQKQILDVLDILHPGIQQSDICNIVEVLLGLKPAPVSLLLDPAAVLPGGDSTRSDLSEDATEFTSMPAGMMPILVDTEKPSRPLSYRGEFPFWARAGADALGPQNYWDTLDWLKRNSHHTHQLEASIDGHDWISLDTFARLTGQESLFAGRKHVTEGAKKLQSGLLGALAELHRSRATGLLFVNGPSASAEVHFSSGDLVRVVSSRPQLQTPEILVRESVLEPTQLPRTIHQVVSERRTIEDVALSDGWHDPEEVRARIIRLRLATLLGEQVEISFHDREAPMGDSFAMSPFPLLPIIVHEAMSARSIRMLLGPRMKSRLTAAAPVRFAAELEAMKLGEEELIAVQQLIESAEIQAWVERYPEYETLYLYLAYVLIEMGLLEERS